MVDSSDMISHKQFENGFKYIEILNKYAHAKIALQGAHIFACRFKDKPPLLWLSKKAFFEEGKAIRGGIPICFPWFGKHTEDTTLPQHGFARTQLWQCVEEKELADGSTFVRLKLSTNMFTLTQWKYKFKLYIEFVIGKTLNVSLHIHNIDTKPFEVSTALHTYFSVSDINKTSVRGLEGCQYYDALETQYNEQTIPLVIDKEVDRVYFSPNNVITLDDDRKKIVLSQSGSNSLVLWNPWKEKSKTMQDMTEDGYRTMLCLETANAREDMRVIAAGETHTLRAKIMQEDST
ncbi:MAG TPA: D-hexose-6-phosphate mutarotase [Epsilonproteobacteria bacterium]|nr:D-hexose-6-phosphate mutarotase [Campylobacterota bacterium]